MPKVLRCKHIGPDKHCQFEAHGDTQDEILEQVAAHAREVHGLKEVTQEMVDSAIANMKDVDQSVSETQPTIEEQKAKIIKLEAELETRKILNQDYVNQIKELSKEVGKAQALLEIEREKAKVVIDHSAST